MIGCVVDDVEGYSKHSIGPESFYQSLLVTQWIFGLIAPDIRTDWVMALFGLKP
jgi:hypothetical protein